MKTDIHPEYVECKVHCSCGNEFATRSTVPSAARRALLGVPPLLHGQAEARRHRWPGRALPAPGREGQDEEGVSDLMTRDARAPLHGRPGGLEGVMMRGASTWAVAVRDPEGDIEIDVREVPGWAERYRNIPLVRGVMALGESIGARLSRRSPGRRTSRCPKRSRSPRRRWAGRSASRSSFFSAIFIVLPAVRRRGSLARSVPRIVPARRRRRAARRSSSATCADRPLKDIRRVFQYHGAEHKAIAAYENDVELTPESAQQFTHRARALRHQLPAHRDGRRDPRVLRSSRGRASASSSRSRIVLSR